MNLYYLQIVCISGVEHVAVNMYLPMVLSRKSIEAWIGVKNDFT
jgi:hypothetical protein